MSKFKQLLALATRLLETEEIANVLRSEVLTLQDSRDRIGADLAEATRIAREKNKQVESLEQKLKSVGLPGVGREFEKAFYLAQNLGYSFIDGYWVLTSPPVLATVPPTPSAELTLARGRLKTLGYEWNGASWVELVKPAAPVAVKPPVMSGAPPASSRDVKPATPVMPAAVPPAECPPALPKIRNEDCEQDPFSDDVKPAGLPQTSTYRGGLKNRCKKCDMVGHFTKNCPRDEKADDQ